MVDITIVNGVYKPTYNGGAPSCNYQWLHHAFVQRRLEDSESQGRLPEIDSQFNEVQPSNDLQSLGVESKSWLSQPKIEQINIKYITHLFTNAFSVLGMSCVWG